LCTHRALEDALAAKELFVALLEYAARLPAPVLREINRLAGDAPDWPLGRYFEVWKKARPAAPSAVDRPAVGCFSCQGRPTDLLGPLFAAGEDEAEELVPAKTLLPLDLQALTAMFEPDGLLATACPGLSTVPSSWR